MEVVMRHLTLGNAGAVAPAAASKVTGSLLCYIFIDWGGCDTVDQCGFDFGDCPNKDVCLVDY